MITHFDKIAFWRGTRRFDGLNQIASTAVTNLTRPDVVSHDSSTMQSRSTDREGENEVSSGGGRRRTSGTSRTKSGVYTDRTNP